MRTAHAVAGHGFKSPECQYNMSVLPVVCGLFDIFVFVLISSLGSRVLQSIYKIVQLSQVLYLLRLTVDSGNVLVTCTVESDAVFGKIATYCPVLKLVPSTKL